MFQVRLRHISCHFDRLDNRGIVVLGLLTRVEIGRIRIGPAGRIFCCCALSAEPASS
jgi:hypothetical protein